MLPSRNGSSAPLSGSGSRPSSHSTEMGLTQEFKARMFLFIACLWPLWVLALFGASSNSNINSDSTGGGGAVGPPQTAAMHRTMNLRNIMDRVDIMGYGPTHPRIAFVVIGDEEEEPLKSTVESIFRNTDLNRVFLICTVMDGQVEDDHKELVDELLKMDQGSVPHWHGLRPDIHIGGRSKNKESGEEDSRHGRKIHTMFHPQRVGLTAARVDAVEFVQLLVEKHTAAGLKSPQEDLILVFLQAGAQLVDHSWLKAVTQALIVPPPILRGDEDFALKLANAVSFRLEDPGKVTAFDEKMAPLIEAFAKASDINYSSGASYGTPAFNGAGIALRLDTFRHLPVQDISLMDPWPANLELALNLWLCADGIDILQDAQITTTSSWMDALPSSSIPMDPILAARFAAVWMDERMQQKFFQAYSTQISRLEWETKVQMAKQSPTFPKGDMAKRCRPFEWYAQEVNNHLGKILEQKTWEDPKASYSDDEQAVGGAGGGVGRGDGGTAKKGGTVKKEEMAQVAADISDHEAKQKAASHPNPNIRANLEEERHNAEQEVKVKNAQVKPEDHHEPPPVVVDVAPVASDVAPAAAAAAAAAAETDGKPKPKVPLRKENLDIVRKAQPMDISFVPIDGDHKEHPHMGAKDEEGNWGYVHDEKALHNSPPPFTWEAGQEREACSLRDNHFRMMIERVVVDVEYERKQNEAGVKRVKIFCFVYTTESGHERIPFIRETWGSKCDGFMVGSTKTDKSLGAVEIPHEGPEEYDNIWQKVRSMWAYVYDNYYEEYDWFHIGGDDLFLLVENMRLYLESEEIRTAANGGIYLPVGNEAIQTPLLLGRRFAYMGNMDDIFDSGGSGYTMNKASLKLLVTEGFPNYFPHAHTFSEDTMLAKIFRKMGVFPYDTQDNDGGERYMPFAPGHHWGYRLPKDPSTDWYSKYSIHIKEGPEHCSTKSLAFHYVKGKLMKRLFALAYGLCSDQFMKH